MESKPRRPRKTTGSLAARPAKLPTEKPSPVPVRAALPRGRWRGGTLRERFQFVRWLVVKLWDTAPVWLTLLIILALALPVYFRLIQPIPIIAPLFTREVQYWAPKITKWAEEYKADPNLLATLMQIESCGLAEVSSTAGAQGLFQVMPMHFDDNENMTDPDTNAKRGIRVIQDCLRMSSGDVGLAMACYNGGPSLIKRAWQNWPTESQRYYVWGSGIYGDAIHGKENSETLNNWLRAGGVLLCRKASASIGLPVPTSAVFPTTTAPVSPTVQLTLTPAPLQTLLPTTALPTADIPPGALPTFAMPQSRSNVPMTGGLPTFAAR